MENLSLKKRGEAGLQQVYDIVIYTYTPVSIGEGVGQQVSHEGGPYGRLFLSSHAQVLQTCVQIMTRRSTATEQACYLK
jgi:hypothetical protein